MELSPLISTLFHYFVAIVLSNHYSEIGVYCLLEVFKYFLLRI